MTQFTMLTLGLTGPVPPGGPILGVLYAVMAALGFTLWNIYLHRAINDGVRLKVALVALNLTLLGICLPILAFLFRRGALPPLQSRGLFWFATAGLATALIGPLCSAQATRRIGVTRTTALRLVDPLFALAIAAVFLGERPGGLVVLGVLLIVAALWLLRKDDSNPEVPPGQGAGAARAGFGFAVTASLIFTLGTTARKVGLGLVPSALIGAGTEGLIGLAILLPTLRRDDLAALRGTISASGVDIWLSGLGAAVGTVCLNLAIQRVPIPVAVALRNTSPWFALLLVPLLLGATARPGRWVWASTALLTVGMLLIVLR